jgi:hypothetical protein
MKIWKIQSMQREKDTGLVVAAQWTIAQSGSQLVLTASIDFEKGSSFIPYEDLTADIVLGWIRSKLGNQAVTELELAHDEQILQQANLVPRPLIETGLPWAASE